MENLNDGPFFHAYYREPGPLPRSACDHALFPSVNKDSDCQFARIASYLFGLTKTGLDMFKDFLDAPELLVSEYNWDKEVIKEIMEGAAWAGERLSYQEAMGRMKSLADLIVKYDDGSMLFLFSRTKVNFNVEVYSTSGLDFIEGFIIASIDSQNYMEFISIIVNEANMVEIEGDYGLNEYPDDNPWKIIYDGLSLNFGKHKISPQ